MGDAIPSSCRSSIDHDAWNSFYHQPVRISASNVAALTGFHPFKHLPELWLSLIYQGPLGAACSRHDAALLDLTFTSPDQVLLDLAEKVGSSTTQAAVQQALQVKRGTVVVADVKAAAGMKAQALQEAAKALSATEFQILQDGIRDAVNTGYGIHHEDDALNLYQAQIQWPVQHRNGEVRLWPFGLQEQVHADISLMTVYPLVSAYVEKSREPSTLPPTAAPYFSIVGSVDGIREELVLDDSKDEEEDELWSIRQIIVECKHRMHKIQATPPLYEQIQSAIYCFMYNVSEAEIVQILRQSDAGPDAVTLSVHRLHLDDPVLQHRHHWNACILPRLQSVTEAIYRIRRDDHARYRFLTVLASDTDTEAWNILFSECAWLRDCDTAFARRKSSIPSLS
jgi:hypothetical protein